MQYRTGKNISEVLAAIGVMSFSGPTINAINRTDDTRVINNKPIPLFLDLEPLEYINSIFSLSKVIEALRLTINTMAKVVTNAMMLLAGCIFKNEARLYPPLIPRKNKTLNKLSLFNLALMKLRIVASFCVLHKYNSCLSYNIKKQLIIVFYYVLVYIIIRYDFLITYTRLI